MREAEEERRLRVEVGLALRLQEPGLRFLVLAGLDERGAELERRRCEVGSRGERGAQILDGAGVVAELGARRAALVAHVGVGGIRRDGAVEELERLLRPARR